MDRVSERAAQAGIETHYVDAYRRARTVPAESLALILDAIGEPAVRNRLVPRAFVIRRGREMRAPVVTLPPDTRVTWMLSQEDREIARGMETPITLPSDLPIGTFRFRIQVKSPQEEREETALVLVAPERAYQGETDSRLWALGVQLYAVRSRRNWGHGDFTDLSRLLDLAFELGAAGLGLNPLHALFDDRPEQASPYAPNSRLFLNPLYIDVSAVPEFPGVRKAGVEAEIRRLRQQDFVDYSGVAAVKLKALRLAHESFCRHGSAARLAKFATFRDRCGDALARFASFETLRRRLSGVWWEWPAPWRTPDEDALATLRQTDGEEIGFFEFVQWIADEQLAQCADKAHQLGLPLGLYLDVAVGVEAGGADAWSEQTAILGRLSVGAPPDVLNTAGQNWGLAGFNPTRLVERDFLPFRDMLKSAMRHAGAIRLDHVLGLKRLFLVPHGMKAEAGAYVHLPFESLLAVVAQESVANRCIVIGEDLGTVPEHFRETLADWGIWSYRVMLFERGPDGSFTPPDQYGAQALVTFNTHDLPTFTGWMTGWDLGLKRALGIDPGETEQERSRARENLQAALARQGLKTLDLMAIVKYLATTPSRLLVVSMEDALEMKDQPNVPGTVEEHPNWRRRLPVMLEDLRQQKTLQKLARVLAEAGRSIGAAWP